MGQMKFEEAAIVLNRLPILKTNPGELRNDLLMRTNSDDVSIEGTEVPLLFANDVIFLQSIPYLSFIFFDKIGLFIV